MHAVGYLVASNLALNVMIWAHFVQVYFHMECVDRDTIAIDNCLSWAMGNAQVALIELYSGLISPQSLHRCWRHSVIVMNFHYSELFHML